MHKIYPRLSRSLRVTNRTELLNINNYEELNYITLKLWRFKEKQKRCTRYITLKELKSYVQNNENKKDVKICLLKYLEQLTIEARKMIAIDTEYKGLIKGTQKQPFSDIIDDAVIFLLCLFLDVQKVTAHHLTYLRKIFSHINLNISNRICKIVIEISAILPNTCKLYLKLINEDNVIVKDQVENKKLWGNHIACKMPEVKFSKKHLLQNYILLPTDNEAVAGFSMQYHSNTMQSSSTNVKAKKQLTMRFNRNWLLNVTKLNSDDVQILITDLRSTKSNDELQNYLFEWLGFDKFDLIETILKNRTNIIEECNVEDRKNAVREKVLSTNNNPLISQNCIVQSKEEKLLVKAIRKDDKKLMKEQYNNKNVNDVDDNDINIKLAIIQKLTREQEDEFSNFAHNR